MKKVILTMKCLAMLSQKVCPSLFRTGTSRYKTNNSWLQIIYFVAKCKMRNAKNEIPAMLMNKQKLYSLANKIPKTSDLKVNKIFSQNITINTLFYGR